VSQFGDLSIGDFPLDHSNSGTQTALLNLDGCTEYFQRPRPDVLNYVKIPSETSQLVIGSYFYDLTPLNSPGGNIVAGLVAPYIVEPILTSFWL
jgi:hypothetical protein